MNVTVGESPVPLPVPYGSPTIQNLGPGTIYFDRADTVSPMSGIRIGIGAVYTIPSQADPTRGGMPRFDSGPLWLISDTPNTDVRFFV